MSSRQAEGEAGFTLVEVLVALALFALIGAAGFAVLDQTLRVQARVDGRLERLAEIQRASYLVGQDFSQAAGGSLGTLDGAVTLRRTAGGEPRTLRYGLEGGTLVRRVSGGFGRADARQALLGSVATLDWRFYSRETGWVEDWPPATDGPPANPAAVELSATLAGPGLAGTLRRVVSLPGGAAP